MSDRGLSQGFARHDRESERIDLSTTDERDSMKKQNNAMSVHLFLLSTRRARD